MQFGFEHCPYCGNNSGFIYIHGHYQCKQCNQNVMPCCGGEQDHEAKENFQTDIDTDSNC